jgi:hypothetical protein
MAKADSVLGLFADESNLIDEITEGAMQARENETGSKLKMIENLKTLLEKMTVEERAEVETFAAYLLVRRKLKDSQLLTDDVSLEELMRLVERGRSFDWLDAEAENVYSIKDGDPVKWPKKT